MPDGVEVTGTGLLVSFGRAETGARAALVKLAGPEWSESAIPGCGVAVRFADGLVARFQAQRFVAAIGPQGRKAGLVCPG